MMSPQQKLDEERGLTPERCIEFALMMIFGGPSWKIVKASKVISLVLKKMGFKIVPMERGDYEQR
jgi:hypothetical protein